MLKDIPQQQFASDNISGMCPEALTALEQANLTGHEAAYGSDGWTQKACNKIRELFETDCEVFFVFNGTAANSLALSTACQSYHSVIAHEVAHIETDECGGPEFFSGGSKILLAGGENGKMNPDAARELITKRQDIHYPKPKLISITQATELGTLYTQQEIEALCDVAKSEGLKVHMDGARFSNAIASLGVHPADITWRAGIDVLCFGGTKNGLPIGDAIVFFDTDLAKEFAYRVKQAGQLASKMRFISAPWIGILENDVWLKNARHANAMAKRLSDALAPIPQISLLYETQANSVFLQIPADFQKQLMEKGWQFYNFIGSGGCRFMCSWDTMEASVNRLVDDIVSISQQSASRPSLVAGSS